MLPHSRLWRALRCCLLLGSPRCRWSHLSAQHLTPPREQRPPRQSSACASPHRRQEISLRQNKFNEGFCSSERCGLMMDCCGNLNFYRACWQHVRTAVRSTNARRGFSRSKSRLHISTDSNSLFRLSIRSVVPGYVCTSAALYLLCASYPGTTNCG